MEAQRNFFWRNIFLYNFNIFFAPSRKNNKQEYARVSAVLSSAAFARSWVRPVCPEWFSGLTASRIPSHPRPYRSRDSRPSRARYDPTRPTSARHRRVASSSNTLSTSRWLHARADAYMQMIPDGARVPTADRHGMFVDRFLRANIPVSRAILSIIYTHHNCSAYISLAEAEAILFIKTN